MSGTKLHKRTMALVLALTGVASGASGATLVVIDARGGGIKPGQKIDSSKTIALKEGERVTAIGPDGKAITLRGPFNGRPPVQDGGSAVQPGMALAALIGTRNARTNSVGVIRSGADAANLSEPWLIDVSRSGERCLRAGSKPVWWRPNAAQEQSLTVMPIDRSWRADARWQAGQQKMDSAGLIKENAGSAYVARLGDQEFTLNINILPADLDNDFVLVSWMLEKGCMQQSDALLRQIATAQGTSVPETPASSTPANAHDSASQAGSH